MLVLYQNTHLVQFAFAGRWNSDQVVFLVLLLETIWPSSKQRWADRHILRSRSNPEFLNFSPSPTKVQNFVKIWSPSPNKIQKIDKMQLFNNTIAQIFPLSLSKSGPDPKLLKKITVRIQSKSNKICHRPDPVQSKSSPMLIYASKHNQKLSTRNLWRQQIVTSTGCAEYRLVTNYPWDF